MSQIEQDHFDEALAGFFEDHNDAGDLAEHEAALLASRAIQRAEKSEGGSVGLGATLLFVAVGLGGAAVLTPWALAVAVIGWFVWRRFVQAGERASDAIDVGAASERI